MPKAAQPRFDGNTKNGSLRGVVSATGGGEYRAAFAWSELDPGFAKRGTRGCRRLQFCERGQNAKTEFPFRVADMAQELEKVCFQAMRLPCHTPSAVTVTGS